MSAIPSLLEDHISQIPALQLLQKLGWTYLRPQEAFVERGGRYGQVLLLNILQNQLRRMNRFEADGEVRAFSERSIEAAVQTLRDLPIENLMLTNERVYDLLTLGKSFEEPTGGHTRSYTLHYIDWQRPERNVYHVCDEVEIERAGRKSLCRPDLVLYVNGIPLGVIECKRPDLREPMKQAISQQLRNQSDDYAPRLFIYSQLLLAVSGNEARYATTGTAEKYWATWREDADRSAELRALVNRPALASQQQVLFADRYRYAQAHFEEQAQQEREPTAQDAALLSLCLPERLLDLTRRFIVFDNRVKKIARYQQYFAVGKTMRRVRVIGPDQRRVGGVIWHTQGSGKSLTMVMLARALVLDAGLGDVRLVLVTDRVDLDDQLWKVFHQCGRDPVRARTGTHLLKLLEENKASVITTVIHKFETAVARKTREVPSANIFVLVDESHRTQYGSIHAAMQRVLPQACYIGFTGTPLMRGEKQTVLRFGGMIDTYTIDQAVRDKSVVPLLYEGRHTLQEVNRASLDRSFDLVAEKLTESQRADLKRKSASADALNKTVDRIRLQAMDISEHFRKNFQGTPYRAQLTADCKLSAIRYKQCLDEIGHVSSAVLISPPDTREGNEDLYEVGKQEVQAFWKNMMAKYGDETRYQKALIDGFLYGDEPEIIIVVDKLLVGFDAPRNTVLYVCRNLKEHALLQAIARVNRLYEGKDFGFILDYYGIIKQLGEALNVYAALPEFDEADVAHCLSDIRDEVASVPQKRSELLDLFKTLPNRLDEEAYERLLADEARRLEFYDKLAAFHRALSVAFASADFYSVTDPALVEDYKRELTFFLRLRVSVKRRYAEEIDYREYEARVQKLVDAHVSAREVVQITPPVNIFERELFEAEVEKLGTPASKADTIAYRTKKTLTERMDEDPFFYRKLSKVIEDAIADYYQHRITDAEYLERVSGAMRAAVTHTDASIPSVLEGREAAKAFFGATFDVVDRLGAGHPASRELAADMAMRIDEIVQRHLVVRWLDNTDVQNAMRNAIDDHLFALRAGVLPALQTTDMDKIVENCLAIARVRYAR
jgi:type I restriction enzyme R subunit